MSSLVTMNEPVIPTQDQSEMAKVAVGQLSQYALHDLHIKIADTDESVILPMPAVRLLCDLLSTTAEGGAVQLLSIPPTLGVQQAADLLGVSHAFLMKELDEQHIACDSVEEHRNIHLSDLMAYKRSMISSRNEVLGELAAQAQDLDMGY